VACRLAFCFCCLAALDLMSCDTIVMAKEGWRGTKDEGRSRPANNGAHLVDRVERDTP